MTPINYTNRLHSVISNVSSNESRPSVDELRVSFILLVESIGRGAANLSIVFFILYCLHILILQFLDESLEVLFNSGSTYAVNVISSRQEDDLSDDRKMTCWLTISIVSY